MAVQQTVRVNLHAKLIYLLILTGVLLLGPVDVFAGEAGMFQRNLFQREPLYPLEGRYNLVKQVQSKLIERGHDPGPVDGIFGPLTRVALEAYQKENGLSGNGRLTKETVRHLGLR